MLSPEQLDLKLEHLYSFAGRPLYSDESYATALLRSWRFISQVGDLTDQDLEIVRQFNHNLGIVFDPIQGSEIHKRVFGTPLDPSSLNIDYRMRDLVMAAGYSLPVAGFSVDSRPVSGFQNFSRNFNTYGSTYRNNNAQYGADYAFSIGDIDNNQRTNFEVFCGVIDGSSPLLPVGYVRRRAPTIATNTSVKVGRKREWLPHVFASALVAWTLGDSRLTEPGNPLFPKEFVELFDKKKLARLPRTYFTNCSSLLNGVDELNRVLIDSYNAIFYPLVYSEGNFELYPSFVCALARGKNETINTVLDDGNKVNKEIQTIETYASGDVNMTEQTNIGIGWQFKRITDSGIVDVHDQVRLIPGIAKSWHDLDVIARYRHLWAGNVPIPIKMLQIRNHAHQRPTVESVLGGEECGVILYSDGYTIMGNNSGIFSFPNNDLSAGNPDSMSVKIICDPYRGILCVNADHYGSGVRADDCGFAVLTTDPNKPVYKDPIF